MKYGYARVSPGGKSESVDAQARQLTKAGCRKVIRDVHVSGAKTERTQLRRVIETLEPGDVLMVTRLDRLARSTRDLLNTLAAITERKAGFRSLSDAWADTTTSHGRLMLTVLGGLSLPVARPDDRPTEPGVGSRHQCAVASGVRDGGRPPATGLQEEVANHRKRHGSKAWVVSVTEKASERRQVGDRKANISELPFKCRKHSDDVKTGG